MKDAAKSPHRALDLVGQRMLAMQKRHFRKQEGPSGTPWAPLKPQTIARRRKGGAAIYRTKGGKLRSGRRYGMETARAIVHFGGAVPVAGIRGVKILQDTGTLYRSLVYLVDADGYGVEVGTPKFLLYGPTHQYGNSKRNIPARPYCYLNRIEAQQLVNLCKKELLRDLGA